MGAVYCTTVRGISVRGWDSGAGGCRGALLQRESKKRQRKRDHSPPERFGFGDARDEEEVQYDEATGCRLVDLDLFNENITRLLPCPRCSGLTLFCRAGDEYRAGLGGTLRFWCHECAAVTHEMPLCHPLPRKAGATGPGIASANARLVLGAAQ